MTSLRPTASKYRSRKQVYLTQTPMLLASTQKEVTGTRLALPLQQLESQTKYMKQLFSESGLQGAQDCNPWKKGRSKWALIYPIIPLEAMSKQLHGGGNPSKVSGFYWKIRNKHPGTIRKTTFVRKNTEKEETVQRKSSRNMRKIPIKSCAK